MNKGIFRLVFNAKRCQAVAVAEIACSQSKAPGQRLHVEGCGPRYSKAHRTLGVVPMGIFMALGWVYLLSPLASSIVLAQTTGVLPPKPTELLSLSRLKVTTPLSVLGQTQARIQAQAQTNAPTVSNIVADPNAPRTQQATVLTAANGVAQVNIQTPSAMGVSRNTYSSFDVGSQGAILNNSRTSVQTQLGGWVQANPWLATGPARVILNEVNSANPSQLRGFVEVAGQRAEVIIANPSGIQVNGAGFINASGVVLSTGQAQMPGGDLDSLQVRRGLVDVSGDGLDTRDADYTAILARAATVNANIWAKNIQVTTGANEIAINNAVVNTQGRGPVTPIAPEGAAPSYALDVGTLGGMYAGKIFLVGTEAGLGVRNAGRVETSSGPLTLSQDGWITNSGTMLSAQKLQISSLGSTTNTGAVYAGGDLLIQTQASQEHGGTTAAKGRVTLQVQGGNQSGIGSGDQSLIASGMDADGQFVSGQPLSIQAQGQVQLAGQTRTKDLLTLQGDSINLSQGKLSANQASITATQGDLIVTGSTITVATNLGLSTPQNLRTDAAHVVTDSLSLQAAAWSNVDGSLLHTGVQDLSIRLQGKFDNTAGVLQTNSRNLTIAADTLSNQDGDIAHTGSGALVIGVRQLNNLGVTIATPVGTIGSRIATNGSLELHASGVLTNQGQIIAGSDGTIQAATLSNQGGALLLAGADLSITATALDNQGAMLARGAHTISTTTLSAGAASLIAAGMDSQGQLAAKSQGSTVLRITATGSAQSEGKVLAYGDVSIQGADIDLQGSTAGSVAGNLSLLATQGNIDTSKATISSAAGQTTMQANASSSQSLINQGGTISAQTLRLQLGQLDNSQGSITQTGSQDLAIDLAAGSLDNSQGQLVSAGQISIKAAGVVNSAGRLVAGQDLLLTSTNIDNTAGLLYATRHLSMDLSVPADPKAIALDNTGGSVIAKTGDINLSSAQGSLINANGLVQAARDMQISLQGSNKLITNTDAGQLIAGGALSSNSGAVDNTGGLISAGTDLTLDTNNATLMNANTLDGDKSFGLQAGGVAMVRGGSLDNHSGYITATDLTVNAKNVNNKGGTAISNASSTLTTVSLDNQGGQWLSVGDMRIEADTIDNSLEGNFRTAANLMIKSDGTIINTNGVMSAAGTLTIAPLGTGTPTLQINNAAGSIKAEAAIDINTAKLSGAGTVAAGTDLTVRIQGDHTTQGVLSAGHDMLLSTTGNYTNKLAVNAGRNLSITANNIDNQVDGQLLSNGVTTLTATQDFSNSGLVDGSTTRIKANTVTNLGTGRIYGGSIGIGAQALTNKEETIGGITKAASIAARNRLDIGAQTIVNQEHALIYSDGDMAIGGALDANWRATGRATSLLNASATIEAANDLSLATDVLTNKNLRVTLTHPSVDTQIADYSVQSTLPEADSRDMFYYTNLTETVTTDTVTTSDSDRAKIVSGRNLTLDVINGTNYFSQIITGGTLAVDLQSNNIANSEPILYKTTVVSGTQAYQWVRYTGGWRGHDEWHWDVSPYQSNPIIVNITAAQTYQSVPFTTPSKSQVTVANSDSNQPSTTTKTAGTNAPAQASDVVIVQNQNVLGAN